ncbi:MAG: BACON domain-containing protein [Marinifilaceae bacterium]|nr:BACON domain-containing protein [Marinifilaceae bacterium]
MMRQITSLLLFLLIVVVFGCTYVYEEPVEFNISDDSVEIFDKGAVFDAQSNTIKVHFATNRDWFVTINDVKNANWCKITPMNGGKGSNSISITADKNNSGKVREMTFTISTKNIKKSLRITQQCSNFITVEVSKFDVPLVGGKVQVDVKTNLDYDIDIPSEYEGWIKQIINLGEKTSKLEFKIERNSEYCKRTGHINIRTDKETATVDINQDGSAILALNRDEQTISCKKQELVVRVNSNFEFATSVDVDWINKLSSRGVTEKEVNFIISENASRKERCGTITFYDLNSDLKETCVVYQLPKEIMNIEKSSFDVAEIGGKIFIDVETNVDVSVNLPKWISRITTQTKGAERKTIILYVDENTSGAPRTGNVEVIRRYNRSVAKTLTVNQEG